MGDNMTYKKKALIILIICCLLALNLNADETTNIKFVKQKYNTAKKKIYKKEWNIAIKSLEEVIANNETKILKDNALYWLAYSLKKSINNIDDRELQVEALELAIKKINFLVKDYPSSNWIDDGKILKIEIAEDLIKRGLIGYKKIIEQSSEEKSRENIKLYALDALLNMNDKKAFPLLKKMIYSDYSIKLKKKAIFVISQQNDKRVLPLLTQISLSNNHYDLTKEAIFWIGQINGKEGLKSLMSIYKKLKGVKLKEKTIFAISQTGEQGITELIKIYKDEKNIKLKKKILFWVGQSKSKKASDFLKEILFE